MENYKKKYEEALERAKSIYNADKVAGLKVRTCEQIFPELKESEDEKIRKGIIEYLEQSQFGEEHYMIDNNIVRSYIAWLEKQGKQEIADKVGPKFKVGNWITDGEYTWKVTVIQLLDYILQSQNGDTVDDTISYVDEHFHLWTIKDAKQGDVLTDGDPFIYKGLNDELHQENPVAYCGINGSGIFISSTENKWWTEDPVYPATKKQCDRLFSKMKEAGYEWDAEKKELRKIEQKPSEWSAEDDEMISLIIASLNTYKRQTNSQKSEDCVEKEQEWLISLKDKVQPQPKQEWSEDDEKIILSLHHALNCADAQNSIIKTGVEVADVVNWLFNCKERFIQPNHWKPSEYDISLLEEIARNIRNNVRPFCSEVSHLEDLIKDLENL